MLVEKACNWQSNFNDRNNTAYSKNVSQGSKKNTKYFYSLHVLQAIWNVIKKKSHQKIINKHFHSPFIFHSTLSLFQNQQSPHKEGIPGKVCELQTHSSLI